jgi:hypothetical protein
VSISQDELQAIKASLARIEQALAGDEKLGHKGIAKRLIESELRQDVMSGEIQKMDRKLAAWGGVVTGASVIITHLKVKLFGP